MMCSDVFLALAVELTAWEVAPGTSKTARWASITAPAETPAMAKRRRREIPVDSVCSMIGEQWRPLKVIVPDCIASHSREQVAYFGPEACCEGTRTPSTSWAERRA
jgi:hypothetical protein